MPTDMFASKPKNSRARQLDRHAAKTQEAGAPGGVPKASDFDHPMPRLMDYFSGKETVEEVDSAAEMGGKREED